MRRVAPSFMMGMDVVAWLPIRKRNVLSCHFLSNSARRLAGGLELFESFSTQKYRISSGNSGRQGLFTCRVSG